MEGVFAAFVQVNVRFRPRRKPDGPMALADGACAGDLLRAVGEPADHTVVVRAGVPLAESVMLADGDELLVLSAFSGG